MKGRYAPSGTNHGRPVYKKDKKVKGLSVLVYFWDDRDGEENSGWWFGPAIGGDQVWAYHKSKTSATPPSLDWAIPHDGLVDSSFSAKLEPAKADAKEGKADKAGEAAEAKGRSGRRRAAATDEKEAAQSGVASDGKQDELKRKLDDMKKEKEDFEREMEDMKRRVEDRKKREEVLQKEMEAMENMCVPGAKKKDAAADLTEAAKPQQQLDEQKGIEDMKRKKEELRRKEEDIEKKRAEDEGKREEAREQEVAAEAARMQEEHAKEAQKQEEQRRRAEEEKERRAEEEKRSMDCLKQNRRSQQATLAVLFVLTKIADARPEEIEAMRALYQRVVVPELPHTGNKLVKLKAEAERVMESANTYSLRVLEQRQRYDEWYRNYPARAEATQLAKQQLLQA